MTIDTLTADHIRDVVAHTLQACAARVRRALLIHPDYSRNDFTHLIAPAVHDLLTAHGLERLDTLNAAGTHRRMSQGELLDKLGLDPQRHPRLGTAHNHDYDDPTQLLIAGTIPADLVTAKTA